MDDKGKTKGQLLGELAEVRQRVAELEAAQSECEQAEETLRRERNLLNRVMETSPAGITVMDRQGKITFANARAEQVLGLTRDEITQRAYNAPEWRITDYAGDPFPDEALPFQRVIATGQPVYDVRHAIEWPDGRRRLLSINTTPLFDEIGQVNGMVSTVEDVTERVQAEKELQESEDKYRTLVEQSLQGIVIGQGIPPRIVFANPAMSEIFGYTVDEVLAFPPGEVWKLLFPDDRPAFVRQYQDRLTGRSVPSHFEARGVRKDGTACWVELRVSKIEYRGEPAWQAAFVDITERKQAEAALRESEGRFRRLTENAKDVIYRHRLAPIPGFEYLSPAIMAVTGYTPEEFYANPELLLDIIHPEDRTVVESAIQTGTMFGVPFTFRWVRKDGTSVWNEQRNVPVYDDAGRLVAIEGIARDVTERKRAEEALRRRTDELQARNEELDAFAHTVAHDLKTPLSLVIGFAEALEDGCTAMSDEDMQRYLQAVARNGRKMENIIDELLLLAEVRRTEVEIAPLDMAGIVAEAQRRLAFLIEAYQATIVLPAQWPSALGYGPWIEEVWVNYVSNALTHGGRPPRIELGAMAQPDGLVRFWVRDNGPGIAPQDQARLFVPFTQLAQVRVTGHGLGLSIVRRIVEKLDGQVGVESESGAGSTFWFALPTLR